MHNKTGIDYDALSVEELRRELARIRENLCDLEETHHFTFGRTSVHIGAVQAQAMQEAYEEECRSYRGRIARIEGILRTKGG